LSKSRDVIRVIGARAHNLKNIDVDIPRGKLVVMTGVSGSGKSSLAFDTIYAEGQRRYMESLSAYARQFLGQMDKPDVESIEGLTPTIAIEQRSGSSSPRSTVATSTEIYDYLRLLYARAGQPHCPSCGRKISKQTAEDIAGAALKLPEGTRIMVLAPVIRGRKGQHREILAGLKREGYVRVRIDGSVRDLEEIPELAKTRRHDICAVVDRLTIRPEVKTRLTDSIETALRASDGLVTISHPQEDAPGKWSDVTSSEKYACAKCDISFQELEPRSFSFNSPYGACPACAGLGNRQELDPELIVPDHSLPLSRGAVAAWRKHGARFNIFYNRAIRRFGRHFSVSTRKPYSELPEDVQRILLFGTVKADVEKFGKKFEGVIPNLLKRYAKTTSDFVKRRIHEYMSPLPCPACHGKRLRPEALGVTVGKKNITEITKLTVAEAGSFFKALKLRGARGKIGAAPLKEVRSRLNFLSDVGLDYLTLDRTSSTLAGGEAQRIRLASQLGSHLVGVTYVLDEPTIGLHQRDNQRLLGTLLKLRDLGNTVLVVEHDEEVIRAADHVIDIGPGAGRHGGEIVGQGHSDQLGSQSRSITGRWLSGIEEIRIPRKRRRTSRTRQLVLRGASGNNLRNINISIPLGCLTCVTGVSGSGKSTLIGETLYPALARELNGARSKPYPYKSISGTRYFTNVINIDQSPIGRTPRSNPATYTGVFTHIRKLFSMTTESKIRGYGPGRFSFNVKGGRCEHCDGDGTRRIEMHFLSDVYVQCEHCFGRRYNAETLQVKYRGFSIADVLAMPIREALSVFKNIPKLKNSLQTLLDVGLGYVQLGQSSTTLSGGEAQRIKISSELGKRSTGRTIYILDEPTTGLHLADISKLLEVLGRLVDAGNTVIVIEHNLDVIKCADWLIDLGPEGGQDGGAIVSSGRPEDIAACQQGHTGNYLRKLLS
jgi:excinuclease ABC subunit A